MINQTKENLQEDLTTENIPEHFLRRAWMEKNKITNVILAKRFALTPARVSYIIRSGECPQKYINILRKEFKMPDSLLPTRSREKSGPKPKRKTDFNSHIK
ncbi:XRE family transcriptional regulator [Maridesulfovibrio ferrireducens]|uniref:XRE family transcriptional regulator n=1 Tax=Maridesulfovibrio ferrireducens TaxID=246191 RepID=UPI001A2DFF16|nr:XRE family transcriptional regulator [Maridesulfovibrio ferrireducens]MBI9113356.1 XRE family transcriptional regulator [Maridesulfovibrio ferrireducens]